MAIFLRQSHNVKPSRWGSFADVQYAIRVNSEKIYDCDPEDDVLVMPLFWGLPCLDYSGYNNHGTNHGATYKDGSLDFDGVNDYVDLGTSDSVDIASFPAFTLSAYVYMTAKTIDRVIVGQGDINNIAIRYDVGTDEWYCYVHDGSGHQYAKHHADVNLNTWTHIVGIYDGTNIKIYVDGVVGNTIDTVGTPTPNAKITQIGNNKPTGSWEWKGTIDEVRISNVARKPDQIVLFYDRPWDLYRRVARPIWSIPAVGVTIPIFMQNMRGSFNSPGTRGGFIN